MTGRRIVAIVCLLLILIPSVCLAGGTGGSAFWTKLAYEENSVTSSLLFIPYVIFSIPVRLIDGVVNPVPTSQATSPPQAHLAPPPN